MLTFKPRTLAIAAAFCVCYAGVAASLVDLWATNYLYSFGFAVPLVSGFVVWSKADQLWDIEARPDYVLGLLLLIAALGLLVIGHLGGLATLEASSMVIALAALILLVLGREMLRALWFPVAYLFAMVPIWGAPIELLQDPSRLLSSRIATGLLHAGGVPAFRAGTIITLPNVTLDVLSECSGVNQLIAITAMTVPGAYLMLQGVGRRVVLVCFAIVVAYLSNGVRIALVGVLAYNGVGEGNLMGDGHLWQGLVVSSLAYLAIWLGVSLLSRSQEPAATPSVSPRSDAPARRRSPALEFAVVVLLLGATAGRAGLISKEISLDNALTMLPERIAGWTIDGSGTRLESSPGIDEMLLGAYPTAEKQRRFLGVDDELVRVYRHEAGDRVQLYIGYHRSQRQGKELTGDASTLLQAAASSVVLNRGAERIVLREVVERSPGRHRGLLYWYDVNGRVVTNIYLAKGYTIWDALTRRRSNAAVVIVAWDSAADVSGAQRERALDFARELLPVLPQFIPS